MKISKIEGIPITNLNKVGNCLKNHLFTPLLNSNSFCPSGIENTRITVPCKKHLIRIISIHKTNFGTRHCNSKPTDEKKNISE